VKNLLLCGTYANKGIAIRTTFKRLSDSFINEDKHINMGKMRYGYNNFFPPDIGWSFNVILQKRKCFEYEQELRAFLIHIDGYDSNNDLIAYQCGCPVKVDPDILIDQIIISPLAPKYYKITLDKLMDDYKLNREAILSTILDQPDIDFLIDFL